MSNKIKDGIRRVLMLIAVIAIFYSMYNLFMIYQDKTHSNLVNKEVVEIIGKDDQGEIDFLTKKSFNQLKEINSDFVGYLYYPSLNINEQVVQTNNNEYYLDHSFYKQYLNLGTVFVEASQNIDDKNTTLYGHWVSNSTLKFSNLHKLKKAEDYEKYKTFYFVDGKYVYEYEVGIVIYHHSFDDYDNIPYFKGDFNENEFNTFINNAKRQQFYDSGVEFSFDDKLMTLQTCITADSDERLVVIARLVNKEEIKDN